MRADGVVLDQPAFGFFADLSQAQKAPGIQHAISIDAVEALNEGILGRPEGVNLFPTNRRIFLCNNLGSLEADRGWCGFEAFRVGQDLLGRLPIVRIDAHSHRWQRHDGSLCVNIQSNSP